MGKSIKKNPSGGNGSSKTQKKFKVYEHKAERKLVKQLLRKDLYEILPHPKEYGNEWASPRDGKQWFKMPKIISDSYELWQRWMRK